MMELDATFLSGLGCGMCLGVSIFALKNLRSHAKLLPKITSASGYKLVFVVRTDLNMTKGKIASQCSHAAVGAYKTAQKSQPELVKLWEFTGQPKIALRTDSINEIQNIEDNAKKVDLITTLVRDAGRTQISSGTTTVLGIGPGPSDLVNKVTGHLKLL